MTIMSMYREMIEKWVKPSQGHIPTDTAFSLELGLSIPKDAGSGSMSYARKTINAKATGKRYKKSSSNRSHATYSIKSTQEKEPWKILLNYLEISLELAEPTPGSTFLIESCQFDDYNKFNASLKRTVNIQGFKIARTATGGIKAISRNKENADQAIQENTKISPLDSLFSTIASGTTKEIKDQWVTVRRELGKLDKLIMGQ